MHRIGEEEHETSWRPRDRQSDDERESRTTVESTEDRGTSERWLNREYYDEGGQGYNPVGAEYLREANTTASEGPHEDEQRWSKSPWRKG
jgi:hypothetical protein